MIENRSYLRKKELWIGNEQQERYLDICIPGIPFQLHIIENKIWQRQEDVDVLLWNNKPQENSEWQIVNGDEMCWKGTRIIFFSDRIEIQAELRDYRTRLLPVRGEEIPFKNFPYYKRSPRVIYQVEEKQIEIQAPPQKKEVAKGSLAQMIIPSVCMMGFTVVMGVVLKRGPYVYMTAGMTIITTAFSVQRYLAQKKHVRKENKERNEYYEEYLLSVRSKIRSARKKERQALDYQYPELPKLEKMVEKYSSRIYERNSLEADFIEVNLGSRKGNSKVKVQMQNRQLDFRQDPLMKKAKDIQKEYEKMEQIPVTIDLKKAHLGIVGSKENVHEYLKYLFAQLTFFQSYHDLQIIFVHDKKYKDDFSYTRWYPHLHLQSMNVIAEIDNEQARDQILGSLQQTLKERRQKVKEGQQETVFLPHFIFIIDEPKMVMNHAIMEYLQSMDMNFGATMIYTTDQQSNLPENIGTVCLLHNSEEAVLLLNERVRVNQKFDIPHIGNVDLERMARNLSVLVHEQGISSKIPEKVTFFEMYHVRKPEELDIRKRWEIHHAHKSLAVPLGLRGENDVVELNLHEKAHGPHGLVAGTTGSGKSEIVQAYILSLALNFHPHEVGFLLIDYKGGGMANLFAKLPHLLGTITNLDKAESMRAMESIKSEMRRRERIFGEAGVNHINGYNQLFKQGTVAEPLPHLFLISDEFAELKKEQPEFMSELISAARIGRSLGIHLILATQKPSGVVDDQIWTNSKFKLCLKVQNTADSKEMLHTPDAANISQRGRAYLQVGNNEIYELFQSAWSGAPCYMDEEKEEVDERVFILNQIGQGEAINRDLGGSERDNQIRKTQLEVTVEEIRKIYQNENCIPVKKTWLPSLPGKLLSPYTREIKDSADNDSLNLTFGIGMIDIPEEQDQKEYVLDLQENGHFLYLASSGYGKSFLLTQIVLGLAMRNSVQNLNFYIIDLGNSALIPLHGLPHVADYMGIEDGEKLEKFQRIILEEIRERKKKMAKVMAQNFTVYNEVQEDKLKAIVIVLDNYDALSELGDAMVSFIQKVSRDGAGLGIYLVVSMMRDNIMRAPTKSNFKERIAGYNFEAGDYTGFIGKPKLGIPKDIKGRAYVKRNGEINLMQLYTPVIFENAIEYTVHLKEKIAEIAECSSETPAEGIPVIPETLLYQMLPEYPDYQEAEEMLPIGIDMEMLTVKYLDMRIEPALIVGAKGSGRTNTVKTLLKQLSESAPEIYLFDSKDEMLREFHGRENLVYAFDAESSEESLQKILSRIQERKEAYQEARIEKASWTLRSFVRTLEPVYIIIDVIQDLFEELEQKKEMFDVLEQAVQYGFYILVTSDNKIKKMTGSKFLNLLAENKSGLILVSAKNQSVFPSTDVRADNHDIDIGYHHQNGKNTKIKLIYNGEAGKENDG